MLWPLCCFSSPENCKFAHLPFSHHWKSQPSGGDTNAQPMEQWLRAGHKTGMVLLWVSCDCAASRAHLSPHQSDAMDKLGIDDHHPIHKRAYNACRQHVGSLSKAYCR